MDIRVSGHQVETGEALRIHVDERLQGIATKYFARAISAQVTFGKGPHDNRFTADIVAHVMQPGVRSYYNLEELWQARPKKSLAAANPAQPAGSIGAEQGSANAREGDDGGTPPAALRRRRIVKKRTTAP